MAVCWSVIPSPEHKALTQFQPRGLRRNETTCRPAEEAELSSPCQSHHKGPPTGEQDSEAQMLVDSLNSHPQNITDGKFYSTLVKVFGVLLVEGSRNSTWTRLGKEGLHYITHGITRRVINGWQSCLLSISSLCFPMDSCRPWAESISAPQIYLPLV